MIYAYSGKVSGLLEDLRNNKNKIEEDKRYEVFNNNTIIKNNQVVREIRCTHK